MTRLTYFTMRRVYCPADSKYMTQISIDEEADSTALHSDLVPETARSA